MEKHLLKRTRTYLILIGICIGILLLESSLVVNLLISSKCLDLITA